MLIKEQTVADPDVEVQPHPPERIIPDYAKPAKGYLETRIGQAFGAQTAHTDLGLLDHPAAHRFRVDTLLEAQRNQGNYYVQQAVENYEKRTKRKPEISQHSAAAESSTQQPTDKPQSLAKQRPSGANQNKESRAGEGMPGAATKYSRAAGTAGSVARRAVPTSIASALNVTAGQSMAAGKVTRPAQVATKVEPLPKGTATEPSKTAPATKSDLKARATSAKEATQDKSAPKAPFTMATPAVHRDGGGSAAADVRQWTSKVAAATRADLNPADLKEKEAADKLTGTGDALLQQQQKSQPDYLAEANRNLPPTPQLEDPPDLQLGALEKKGREMIALAAGYRLSDQSLPELEPSPGYPQGDAPKKVAPRIPWFTPPAPAPEPVPDMPPSAQPGAEQLSVDSKDQQDAQKKIDQPATADQPASPQRLTLQDKGPFLKPDVPETMKSDIGDALALVLSKADDEAKEIVDGAEAEAFPGDSLKQAAPELAQAELGPEKQDIEKELHQVADAAGLAGNAIDERAKKLIEDAKTQADNSASNLNTAASDVKKKAEDQGGSQLTAIKTASKSVQASIESKTEAAKHPPDDKAIEDMESKVVDELTHDAALLRAQYTRAFEMRKTELNVAATKYEIAYRRTAKVEADDIKALYKDDDVKARVESRPSLDWADKQVKTLRESLPFLNRTATEQSDYFKDAVHKQESDAVEAVHVWARGHLSTRRAIWRKVMDIFSRWFSGAKHETEAWEEVRDQETTNQIVEDLSQINKLKELAAQGKVEELKSAVAGLNEEQQALLLLFFRTGSNSIITVSSSLLTRMEVRHIPLLTEKFRKAVLDLNWEKLNILGQAQDQGFDANRLAWEVHNAIAGIGTDEDRLFTAVGRRTPVQMAAMRKCFAFLFPDNPDMDSEIDDDLSGDEADRAKAALANDPTGEDVFALHDAIASLHPDNATIVQILRNKTASERDAIFARYRKEYDADLKEHLDIMLDGTDRDRADALLTGDTTTADGIAVEQAMHYHWYGGSEIKELDGVYAQIRQEVEADAQGKAMTTAEIEAEVKRRSQAVQTTWEAKFGDGKAGSMKDAFKDRFDDAEEDLALSLADDDRTRQDASRIGMESQSFITRDEKVLKILSAQHERAEADVNRDRKVHLDELAEQEQHGKISKEEYKQKSDAINALADSDIVKKADENLDSLESVYDKAYSKGWGPGALTAVVELEMSGQEQDMARAIRKKGGHGALPPEDEIFYSIDGLGHNTDHLKHALLDENGQPKWKKSELDKMNESYKAKHDGRNMYDDIGDEWITGRDGFDIKTMALQGKPETAEQYRAQMHSKAAYELGGSGGVGFLFAGDERQALTRTVERADEIYDEYQKAKNEEKNPSKADALFKRYQKWSSYTDNAVKGTRESVDAITNHVAMVGAIIVGIIVAVATAGTASPAVVAALAALAATATSLTIKSAMKGNEYSLEEMGTDAAVGAVDVAAAALTAGIGNALLRTNVLSSLAEEELAGRILSQTIAHGVGGMAAGVPAGVTGMMLDPHTWESDDIAKTFLLGTVQTAGTGFAFGGVMGSIHGIKAPAEAHLSGNASPRPELHEVPNARPRPELVANARAAAESHPPTQVETQLKPILHADELPHTPGSPEAEVASKVAKVKAIADPSTPKATVDQSAREVVAAEKPAKAAMVEKTVAGETASPETKSAAPDAAQEANPTADSEKGRAAEGHKGPAASEDARVAAAETPAEKGTAAEKAEAAAKPSTKKGKPEIADAEKAAAPVEEKGPPTKAEAPTAEDLRAARQEQANLEGQKSQIQKQMQGAEFAVNDKEAEIENLEFDLEENSKESPRTRDIEKERTDLERRLKLARRELQPLIEQQQATSRLEGRLKEIDGRLGEIQGLEDRFKGSKPWRQFAIDDPNPADPDTHNHRIGVYGELEAATSCEDAGFKPKGSTIRPGELSIADDFETAVKERAGKQDIDLLYEPPDTSKYDYAAVESKTTGSPLEGMPTGIDRLKETNYGYQESTKWLIQNAPKSGMTAAEVEAFEKALEKGRVRRVYALTDPKNGTRFFEIESVGDTEVKIGREITHEFKKR